MLQMKERPVSTQVGIRFGLYELDVPTRELRKRGHRVKLQEKPFQVVALLARPSQVVTREEVRQKLWPADTFVDFDNSMNAASTSCVKRWGIQPRIRALLRPYRDEGTVSLRP
jgi:DNA-binding response OmpR family regulator